MLQQYGVILLELFIGFVALFVFTKLIGKSQFSQITPFDFISALILGELIGNAIYDDEVNVIKILIATAFWGILVYGAVFITQKKKSMRKLLEGEPSIIVHKGKFSYHTLKKNRLDLNQALMLIRQQGYFSINEIEYAILETNGLVSVLPKAEFDTPTRQDMKLQSTPATLATNIILDGEVLWDNLKLAGLDENWLRKELSKQHVDHYSDVFFAEYIPGKRLFIHKYDTYESVPENQK